MRGGTALALGLVLLASPAAAITGAPHPVWGKVFFECSPAVGAGVTVTNQRTGEILSASTAVDGSWTQDLTNLPSGFSNGDVLEVGASLGGSSSATFLLADTSATGQRAPDLTLDRNPTVAITSHSNGTTVSAASAAVEGDVDGTGSTPLVSVNGLSANLTLTGYAGRFSATVSLALGANTITAVTADCRGNTADHSITLSYAPPAPTAPAQPAPAGGARLPEQSPAAEPPTPTATPEAPPRPVFSGLLVYPPVIDSGKRVVIAAAVTNQGGNGILQVTLLVNGTQESARNLSLKAGERANVTFYVSRTAPGIYPFSLGSLSGSFEVREPPPTPPPIVASNPAGGSAPPKKPLFPGFEAVLALVAILIAASLLQRGGRRG